MTMTLIEHQELASAAASITFSSIPQTYTDLVILFSGRGASGSDFEIKFNGSSLNSSDRRLYGSGSGAFSSSNVSSPDAIFLGDISDLNDTANTFANSQIYIPNYAGSLAKSVSIDTVSEHNGTQAFQHLIAGLWNDTAAITSVAIQGRSGSNLVQYSSATLYGITAGSDGIVTVS
jgi:hypothetical protein